MLRFDRISKINKLRFPWDSFAIVTTFFICAELYVKLVVPMFNFGGMTYNPREDWYIELIILLFTSFLLPYKINKPSDFFNWLYLCVLLVPTAILSAEQGSNRFHLFFMFVALGLLLAYRWFFALLLPQRTIVKETNYKFLPYYSVFIFVIVVLTFLAVSVRGVFNLNFGTVYDFRFEISQNMPLLLRYLIPLASGTLIGYLGALTTHRREVKGIVIIIIIGILFFGFSSHKAMLFNPLVAIAGYFLLKMQRPHLLILCGISAVSILTIVLPEDGIKWLGSLFANRVLFIPSQINFVYFDYFSTNPFMMWAESKISFGLVSSKLPMSVMKYIGGMMTGNYEVGANTGWVANAYMNAGILGIIIYAAIIGFIFALIDFWAKIYGNQLVGAVFLIPVNTLFVSADLLIILMTSGLFVLLMIFQITTMRISMRKRYHLKKEQMAVFHNV